MASTQVAGRRGFSGFARFVVGLLALMGFLAALAILAGVVFVGVAILARGSVPSKTILELDFREGLVEYLPDEPLARLMHKNVMTVRDVLDGLEKASGDDRVVGLIAKVGSAPLGLAVIQEVREAVLAFRATGKPAVAYAETFGEFGPGNGAYYLATAFDAIYLMPSGDVGLTGIMYQSPFIKGSLNKLGIVPRMDHRYEYKDAMNLYTEDKYTRAQREAMQAIMESQFGQIVKGIGEARNMSEDEVRALIDRGPFLGKEALDARLVDHLAYRDEAIDAAKETMGGDGTLLVLSRYLERAGRPHEKGTTIALIQGVGEIRRGTNRYDPLFGTYVMGSDSVTAAFRAAVDDDEVKAILFRVDSPGGSYVASDAIWRETVRARDAGKPVIVSMGNLAGSGGYFVAMAADKIVAQPGTITASIGVLGGKLVMSGLYEKLGVTWDEVHSSTNSTFWSDVEDYTPAQWERFQAWLDSVYADFTTKVASGRGLPLEKVLEVAKGRIWSGQDAKTLGLVDELGGYASALRLARQALDLPPDARVHLRVFPKEKSVLELLFEAASESSDQEAYASALARSLRVAQPYLRWARQVGLAPGEKALAMAPVEAMP